MSIFNNINLEKLKAGLAKTRNSFVQKISETLTGKAKLDEEVFNEVEEILITSDIGSDLSLRIIEELKRKLVLEKERNETVIRKVLKEVLLSTLNSNNSLKEFNPALQRGKPFIIMVVGVNGVGKTTTVGKIANNFAHMGKSVLIGAADTFRAAANEQLEVWAKRAKVEIFQKSSGSDPSAVAYETIKKALEENYDVVLIDTAGRLHTKQNLMDELGKINRVIKKLVSGGPDETFLVVDGSTGQNAIQQAKLFSKVVDLSGIIVTKLDGTAKGGVVIRLVDELKTSIPFIGVGEGIDDLQVFNKDVFVTTLVDG